MQEAKKERTISQVVAAKDNNDKGLSRISSAEIDFSHPTTFDNHHCHHRDIVLYKVVGISRISFSPHTSSEIPSVYWLPCSLGSWAFYHSRENSSADTHRRSLTQHTLAAQYDLKMTDPRAQHPFRSHSRGHCRFGPLSPLLAAAKC